jgi:hypothetical protein
MPAECGGRVYVSMAGEGSLGFSECLLFTALNYESMAGEEACCKECGEQHLEHGREKNTTEVRRKGYM